VNTDIHDGVWRLRPPRSGTLTGGAILRPSIGGWVLGVAFVEATFIVLSSVVLRAKALSLELEHDSTVSWHSCSPALLQGSQPWIRVVYRLRYTTKLTA